MLLLAGCSTQSPQERAEETAAAYMDTKLGTSDTDIESFACEGVELMVYPEGSGYFGHGYEATVRGSVLEEADGGDAAHWAVEVSFDRGGGMTPTSTIEVSEDGGCVLTN